MNTPRLANTDDDCTAESTLRQAPAAELSAAPLFFFGFFLENELPPREARRL